MRGAELLDDGYVRIPLVVGGAVEELDTQGLLWQPDPGANTIAWLAWHLARVQDAHLAELHGEQEQWVQGAWALRFGLAQDTTETGYGHTREEMLAVRPDSAEAVVDYLDVVTQRTRAFLASVTDDDLDRIVDRSWDPPVTMGVRLVSVLDDGLQHAGQAAYLRGMYDRTR
jgi:uncharacterized damage-inducible protein DinB